MHGSAVDTLRCNNAGRDAALNETYIPFGPPSQSCPESFEGDKGPENIGVGDGVEGASGVAREEG